MVSANVYTLVCQQNATVVWRDHPFIYIYWAKISPGENQNKSTDFSGVMLIFHQLNT